MIVLQEKETAQETFDYVVGKLREQKVPAMENGGCVYGRPGGIRCAIGHLMGEESCYGEFCTLSDLVGLGIVKQPKYFALLRDLQECHDNAAKLAASGHSEYQGTCIRNMLNAAKDHWLNSSSAQEWYNAATQGS